MIIVSNATPLIGLAVIGRFNLLQQLFGQIQIAQAVYDEVIIYDSERGGARDEVLSANWINIIQVMNRKAVNDLCDELDLGEAETIVLAQESEATWVLMDEKKGRHKLDAFGLNKIGTADILLEAKRFGLLSQIRPDLELLRRYGFRLSQPVMNAVLRQANE